MATAEALLDACASGVDVHAISGEVPLSFADTTGSCNLGSRQFFVRGQGYPRPVIDFASRAQVINVDAGGLLGFENVVLQGVASTISDPAPSLEHQPLAFGLWPSVTLHPNATTAFVHTFTAAPGKICGPDGDQRSVQLLRGVLGEQAVSLEDGVLWFTGNHSIAFPVVGTNRNSSNPVGTWYLQLQGPLAVQCVVDPAFTGGAPQAINYTGVLEAPTQVAPPVAATSSSSNSNLALILPLALGIPFLLFAALALLYVCKRNGTRSAHRGSATKDAEPDPSHTLSSASEAGGDGSDINEHLVQRNHTLASRAAEQYRPAVSISSFDIRMSVHAAGTNAESDVRSRAWQQRFKPPTGITMGRLLGYGSHGRVYKARWQGSAAAVKVLVHRSDQSHAIDEVRKLDELHGHICLAANHPNVVRCFVVWRTVVSPAAPDPYIFAPPLSQPLLGAAPAPAPLGPGPGPATFSAVDQVVLTPGHAASHDPLHGIVVPVPHCCRGSTDEVAHDAVDVHNVSSSAAGTCSVAGERLMEEKPGVVDLWPPEVGAYGWARSAVAQRRSRAPGVSPQEQLAQDIVSGAEEGVDAGMATAPCGKLLDAVQPDSPPDSLGRDELHQILDRPERADMLQTCILMEFMDRGSLLAAIQSGMFRLPDGQPALIDMCEALLDIARALEFLHNHQGGIVHADVKPSNVLLQTTATAVQKKQAGRGSGRYRRNWVCKLADLGLAHFLGGDGGVTHCLTGTLGTVTFAAPEMLMEGRLSRAVDIYALGCTAFELLCGRPPFHGMQPGQVVYNVTVLEQCAAIPEEVPAMFRDFITACWAQDPAARPTIEELVQLLQSIRTEVVQC